MRNKLDSLQHFGIFGMHWGVRRFQNPDGTLTEEGKKRYAKEALDRAETSKKRMQDAERRLASFRKEGFKSKEIFDDDEIEDVMLAEGGREYVEKMRKIYIRDMEDAVGTWRRDAQAWLDRSDYLTKAKAATLSRAGDVYFNSLKRQENAEKKKPTLSERFDKAQKDNPKLTYAQIYKEMKVNMNSDDPDDYKNAEDRWFKKHGY